MKWTRSPWSGGAQNLGDGGLRPLVGVADDELDAAQPRRASLPGAPQNARLPRGRCRGRALLAPAVAMNADGDIADPTQTMWTAPAHLQEAASSQT